MPFVKGKSGNPAGRPRGIPNPTERLRRTIGKDLEGIIEAMVTAAQGGDTAAAKLLLDRTVPALKTVGLPVALEHASTLTDTGHNILSAVSRGQMTPEQAGLLLSGIGTLARVIETDELLRRIEVLERSR